MKKSVLSGNEAIAHGAEAAGVHVGTGYPGTPSTEILEHLTEISSCYTEWSVNEKVALEIGAGSSFGGARTLVTMKHVGLNVAADPLFTVSYIGAKGGLVIAIADDPNMHSSQNEQDSRHYARAAKLPMLEPGDSGEAMEYTRFAFELSEKFSTPVIVRSVTRVSHGQSIVELPDKKDDTPRVAGFEKNPRQYVMIPAFARDAHVKLEERIDSIKDYAEEMPLHSEEIRDTKLGFISTGMAAQYVREAFPEASLLKLGMVFPLPEQRIRDFIDKVGKVFIVEELDPFLETEIRSMGIPIEGKQFLPRTGELDPATVRAAFSDSALPEKIEISSPGIPPRPPSLCPGCPHQRVFEVLRDLGVTVTGDIGCYTLGVLPPYSAMDTCVDMGASISVAQGLEIAANQSRAYAPDKSPAKIAAVIGDSTFAHSGLTGLVNAAYNKRHSLIIVLDNGTTAMTGMQPNPFSGETLMGEEAFQIDYQKLAESASIGSENYAMVNAYKSEEIQASIEKLLATEKLSLLVVKGTCVILKRKQAKKQKQAAT